VKLFLIQLHPNERDRQHAVARAKRALKDASPAVGLDFSTNTELDNKALVGSDLDFEKLREAHIARHGVPGVTQNLRQFSELAVGDIGLVHGGAQPVALIRVIGPYEFHPEAKNTDAL
jgi:hypothetical protein